MLAFRRTEEGKLRQRITRVINNNVVAAVDDESHELVLMGNGIGFHRKLGDRVDPAAVEDLYPL